MILGTPEGGRASTLSLETKSKDFNRRFMRKMRLNMREKIKGNYLYLFFLLFLDLTTVTVL